MTDRVTVRPTTARTTEVWGGGARQTVGARLTSEWLGSFALPCGENQVEVRVPEALGGQQVALPSTRSPTACHGCPPGLGWCWALPAGHFPGSLVGPGVSQWHCKFSQCVHTHTQAYSYTGNSHPDHRTHMCRTHMLKYRHALCVITHINTHSLTLLGCTHVGRELGTLCTPGAGSVRREPSAHAHRAVWFLSALQGNCICAAKLSPLTINPL